MNRSEMIEKVRYSIFGNSDGIKRTAQNALCTTAILATLEALREPTEAIGRIMWERYQDDRAEGAVDALRGAFTAAVDGLRADIGSGKMIAIEVDLTRKRCRVCGWVYVVDRLFCVWCKAYLK